MFTWRRNASRYATGDDTSLVSVFIVATLAFVMFMFAWELAGIYLKGFAARNANPSAILSSLWENLDADLYRLKQTFIRGLAGMAAAFFIAYPLGALLACIGKITRLSAVLVCLALTMPKLAVMLLIVQYVGYNETSVYVISMWTACLMMVSFGFYQALILLQDKDEAGQALEAAVLDGVNRWQLFWYMVLPLLRQLHIGNLFVLSPYVWTSVTFAEMMVAGGIIGIGREMQIYAGEYSTMDRFYSVSFHLWIILEIGSWIGVLLIYWLIFRKTKIPPSL